MAYDLFSTFTEIPDATILLRRTRTLRHVLSFLDMQNKVSSLGHRLTIFCVVTLRASWFSLSASHSSDRWLFLTGAGIRFVLRDRNFFNPKIKSTMTNWIWTKGQQSVETYLKRHEVNYLDDSSKDLYTSLKTTLSRASPSLANNRKIRRCAAS